MTSKKGNLPPVRLHLSTFFRCERPCRGSKRILGSFDRFVDDRENSWRGHVELLGELPKPITGNRSKARNADEVECKSLVVAREEDCRHDVVGRCQPGADLVVVYQTPVLHVAVAIPTKYVENEASQEHKHLIAPSDR